MWRSKACLILTMLLPFGCPTAIFAQSDSFDAPSSSAPSENPASPSAPKPPPSAADDSTTTERTVKTKVRRKVEEKKEVDRSRQSGTGYGIFGGADLGILFTTPSGIIFPKLESSQLGATPTAKFLGTVFTRRIVLDFGVGLQSAFWSGERIGQIDTTPSGDEEPVFPIRPIKEPYSNSQISFLAEGAARLKFKQKFQAGIVGTAIYSGQSTGFTSLRQGEDKKEPYTVFIGPQFIFETPFKNYISRLGASFSLSLTNDNRTAFIGNLHAALGSFLNDTGTVIRTQKETKVKTKIVKEVISLKARNDEVKENISFIFDSQMINFKLNSADLSEKSTRFVAAIGKAFAEEKSSWDKLIIEGHTDTRGSPNYNLKLSAQRAKSVTTELEKAGIPSTAMVTTGLGSSKPIIRKESSEVDFARNRRVEIRVLGLKDARKLQQEIDKIQNQFFGRSTPAAPPSTESDDAGEKPKQETPKEPTFEPGLDSGVKPSEDDSGSFEKKDDSQFE